MDEKERFLTQLRSKLKSRKLAENFFKVFRVILMVLITICGFLTAAASQNKDAWFASSNYFLFFGLISAVCAVLNQTLSPSEKTEFHKNVKKALQKIDYAVDWGNLEIKDGARLQAIAITDPEIVFKEIAEKQLEPKIKL